MICPFKGNIILITYLDFFLLNGAPMESIQLLIRLHNISFFNWDYIPEDIRVSKCNILYCIFIWKSEIVKEITVRKNFMKTYIVKSSFCTKIIIQAIFPYQYFIT